MAFFIATIISILDSMGDYFACARTCHVSAPPVHAVNRGILIEGLCTFLSGSVGCGHATTTYGDAIGALAITKVLLRTCNSLFIHCFYIQRRTFSMPRWLYKCTVYICTLIW